LWLRPANSNSNTSKATMLRVKGMQRTMHRQLEIAKHIRKEKGNRGCACVRKEERQRACSRMSCSKEGGGARALPGLALKSHESMNICTTLRCSSWTSMSILHRHYHRGRASTGPRCSLGFARGELIVLDDPSWLGGWAGVASSAVLAN
jgi:hypothetical protein